MTNQTRMVTVMITGVMLVACAVGAALYMQMSSQQAIEKSIPPGYQSTLHFTHDGQALSFGPFVGYYFRHAEDNGYASVSFICLNERQFYTLDRPKNALLFSGDGVLTTLPKADVPIPDENRINPVFFAEAPQAWKATRPQPQDAYLHFHSCYNDAGAVRTGYWLRHVAKDSFVYDMGGRVREGSPLYHQAEAGTDLSFARIIEFDQGPTPQNR